MQVLIIGAGGHGQVVADILLCCHKNSQLLQPIGYLDDNAHLIGQEYLGLPVLGTIPDLDSIPHDAIVIAIGNNRARAQLFQQLRACGEQFATACHPRATIGLNVTIGVGTMICAGVVINPGSVIGNNVILNTSCSVDHHNYIADHAHLAPGVHLGGQVTIGEGALVGIGATIMPEQQVGAWSVVGAGTLVRQTVPHKATMIGVPGRIVKIAE
jgi:sugar O-acyltransferase (sialic acid O-acetyltransferase NeuD family)